MKVTNLKTIYLSEKEVKEAISCWMQIRNPFMYSNLATHLKNNTCTYDWEMKNGKFAFVVSINGEVEVPPPHLDEALPTDAAAIREFEEEMELYKTYGGD
jgi:hypothetical protein|tara:strand:+ start:840 stop:1139 length:300 start_codon:yes stop_codon:yes gene_type:complete